MSIFVKEYSVKDVVRLFVVRVLVVKELGVSPNTVNILFYINYFYYILVILLLIFFTCSCYVVL